MRHCMLRCQQSIRKRQTRATIASTKQTTYEEGGRLGLIGRQGYETEEGGDSMHKDEVGPRGRLRQTNEQKVPATHARGQWTQQSNKYLTNATRFGATRTAKTAAECVLGVAEGPRSRYLMPKLTRIGYRVGLHEARSTNLSSFMVDGVSVDGLMPRGRP